MWRETVITLVSTLMLLPSHMDVEGLKIRELRIPRPIVNGSVPYSILDCDFTYEPNDLASLVVKWFLNSNQFYQWIPPQRPQALGSLSHRLDLEYRASEDNYTTHRALKILQPTFELAGDYRCQVSSFEMEDDRRGTFVVYVPASFVKIEYKRAGEDSVNISCVASGLFPKPFAEMFVIKGRKQNRNAVPGNIVVSQSSTGLYNVALYRVFEENKLSAETVFECVFSIPSTDYSVFDRLTYYPGSGSHAVAQPTSHVKSLVFSTEPSFIGVPTVMDNSSPPSSLQVPPTSFYALPLLFLLADHLTMTLVSFWC